MLGGRILLGSNPLLLLLVPSILDWQRVITIVKRTTLANQVGKINILKGHCGALDYPRR